MTRISVLTALLLAAAPLAAYAEPKTLAVMDIAPDAFVQTVASSNAFEIRSSELAATKAQDAGLKSFAAQMVADHTEAAEKLRAAAGQTPVPDRLSPKHAGMIALLEGATGSDFDRLYADMQMGAHAEAVTLFSMFLASAPDGPLADFAAGTLPTLEGHKTHIDRLVGGVRHD